MKVTYTAYINLEAGKPSDTFKGALKEFITRLKAQDVLSDQLLETACWIERKVEGGSSLPLYFYDSRDFGFKMGLLNGNSDFVEDGKEPNVVLMGELYLRCVDAEDFIKNLPDLVVA